MILETVLWIIVIIIITYKYDIILLTYNNKMSDNYHFIIFSYLIIFLFNIFSKKKKKLNESLIWITFIIIMSISCRNNLGEDLDTFNFIYFSLIMLYLIYIFKIINPKEEKLVILKIIIILLIVFKIFWPTITYLWPYGSDYPNKFNWSEWPNIDF